MISPLNPRFTAFSLVKLSQIISFASAIFIIYESLPSAISKSIATWQLPDSITPRKAAASSGDFSIKTNTGSLYISLSMIKPAIVSALSFNSLNVSFERSPTNADLSGC